MGGFLFGKHSATVFNRKYVLYAIAHQRNPRSIPECFVYFGQPSGGFFFSKDFRTAACHGPFSLSLSALGPGVALALFSLFFRFGFFIATPIIDP
jgi:hypothetical protein